MKRPFVLASSSLALMTAAACAATGDEDSNHPPAPGGSTMLDGSVSEPPMADATVDAPPPDASCSQAGWCITSLPDANLSLKDVWPIAGRAFAVAESPSLGVKVLEWEDGAARWSYIDDNTQNEPGFGAYVGNVWAESENELYYAVAPGTIYHGTRASPTAAWTWTRASLVDNSPDQNPSHDHGHPSYPQLGAKIPALGVRGSIEGEVYAWYANTIYRADREGSGDPAWVTDYVADDPGQEDEHLFFLDAAFGPTGDVWFAGARDVPFVATCALVARKSAQGYERVADGVVQDYACLEREGALKLGGPNGWLTDLQVGSEDRVLGLKGTHDVLELTRDQGAYSFALSTIPQTVAATSLRSLWSGPSGTVWLSGAGLVVQGIDVWDDAGTYRVSTIALGGAPLNRVINRVRGTSNSNLWAVGEGYALHKTTP